MSTQAGNNFLLTSFTLLALFVSTWVLSQGIKKNHVFYTWVIGLGLGCLGTLQIGISLLLENNSMLLDLTNDPFTRSPFVLSGLFLYLIALTCQPLMFCGLRLSGKTFRLVSLALIVLLIVFVALIKLITLHDAYLLRLIVLHSFTMAISLWLMIEVILLRKFGSTPTLNIIFAIAVITFCVYITCIAFIFLNISGVGVLSFGYKQINEVDLHFRFLRGSLFIVSQIVIFVYWLQTQSAIAIAEKKNKESILNLLLEKDNLISHLVNTRALVETGALSAGVAHELNQFLARIQINAEEAEALLDKSTSPKQVKDSLIRIQDSVRSASSVINSIKKLFSKTDPDFSTTRIDLLLLSMADIYFDRAKQSEISVDVFVDAGMEWFVCETLLRQVLVNLISNSIESLETIAKRKKKIDIYAFVHKERLFIEVHDNGIGVAPNKTQQLFSLFSTNKSNGVGVGLWLSMCIVEQHSGSIRHTVGVEGGAVFTIEIPRFKKMHSNMLQVFE